MISLLLPYSITTAEQAVTRDKNIGSFYDLDIETADGKARLSDFNGQVTLVVNTASRCGFTYQLGELEELYDAFKDRGFSVLAFPSNDFGGQEPGNDAEIAAFCEGKYDTTFPIFPKAPVTGADKQAAYRFLTEQSDKAFQGDPGWNFVKFLVDGDGRVVGRFTSMTGPTSKRIKKKIEALLSSE